jgi:hypothetical protein
MADIPGAKKPIIFLKQQPKPEEIIATAVIYQVMKNQQKEVVVFAGEQNSGVAKLKELVPGIEIKNQLPPRKFILSFKKDSANVENVQWQQDEQFIKLFVTLSKGKLTANNLRIEVQGGDYDLAILPNVTELGQLGSFATTNADFFKDVKLFTIGSDLNLGDSYQYSSSNRPNTTTLAEQVYYTVGDGQLKPEHTQLLLSSIMLETSNLTKELKSTEIFMVMKKLVEKGAQTTQVTSTTKKVAGDKAGQPGQEQGGAKSDGGSKPEGAKPQASQSQTNQSGQNSQGGNSGARQAGQASGSQEQSKPAAR